MKKYTLYLSLLICCSPIHCRQKQQLALKIQLPEEELQALLQTEEQALLKAQIKALPIASQTETIATIIIVPAGSEISSRFRNIFSAQCGTQVCVHWSDPKAVTHCPGLCENYWRYHATPNVDS